MMHPFQSLSLFLLLVELERVMIFCRLSFLLSSLTIKKLCAFKNILEDHQQARIALSVNSTTNHYILEVIFKRSCARRQNDSFEPAIANVLEAYGPEEMLFQIEGLSLQTYLPYYDGCSKYSHEFIIYQTGVYRLNVILLRSNDTALNSVPIHPQLDYNILYGDWLWLNSTLHSSINCSSIENQKGLWVATNDNVQKTSGVFRDLEIAKTVKPRRFSNKFFHNGLIIDTNVHLSASIASPKMSCSLVIDQFHWVADPQTHFNNHRSHSHCRSITRHISPLAASKLLAHHKLAFVGDSHTRVFVNTLLLYACELMMDNYVKDPPYGVPGKGKPCEGMIVKYYNHRNCEEVKNDVTNYEVIIMNCGHHDASGLHGSFTDYKKHVERQAKHAMELGLKQDQLFWMESNPMPIRRDKYVIDEADWRTYYRLSVFNQIASPVYTSQGYSVIKAFDALLPMVDRTCDEAHFTALGNTMPMIQQLLTILHDKLNKK